MSFQYVDTTAIDKRKITYPERSQIRFGFLKVEKSAAVIVDEGANVITVLTERVD